MSFPNKLAHYEEGDLQLDPTRLLVGVAETVDREEAAELLEEHGLRLEEGEGQPDEDGEFPATPTGTAEAINHGQGRFWARNSEPIDDDTIEQLADSDEVEWVSPAYQRQDIPGIDGILAPVSNALLVEYDEQNDEDTRAGVEADYDLESVDWKNENLLGKRYYRLSEDGPDIFNLREEILAADGVADVRFEMVALASPLLLVPDDTHFGDQWDMTQIDAPDGWDLSTGDSSVVIGVFDTGVEDHEDLNLDAPGFSAIDGSHDGSPPNDNAHGTCVAGIAAARTDNATGVAGVGGDCAIYPIVFGSPSNTDLEIGINHAATTAGVDVLNMSLKWPSDPDIDTALENAHDSEDVVLVAASGNDNSSGVKYPANHNDVIAVGASDESDERKRPASPDGEPWGGTYGSDLDVAAPGVQCWSTDLAGTDGYNDDGGPVMWAGRRYGSAGPADGDYFSVFNGTSAASPHVAGLAGLVRSLDPSLSTDEVRGIIERTCDKVSTGTYSYSTEPGKPHGTWNDEMGYGRINVHSALSEILSVELTTNPVTFRNVPEGHTTNAAAVFRVLAPFSVDLRITSGPTTTSGPGQFRTFDPPGTETTVGPTGGGTVTANVFVFFEAGSPGSTTTGTVTIECPQTNESWDVDLRAHSVAREDAGIVPVLDHSGSMRLSSGVQNAAGRTLKRMELLKRSIDPLLSIPESDDGIGAVAFSTDANTLTDLRDAGSHAHPAHRVLTEDRIDGLSPDRKTSIAEGILEAEGLFDDPSLPNYTNESIVVFTDGHDNPGRGKRHLTDPAVQNAIDKRVFAIGMGTPSQLQPTTLKSIADGTGGYFTFTGNLSGDDIYRLRKYFLQVLAGATNAEIVVDPERRLRPGHEHRIPFSLTAADVDSEVILLTPRWRGLFEFGIETPDGRLIDPALARSTAGVSYIKDEALAFYRLRLPVMAGSYAAHGGTWHAVVSIDEDELREFTREHEQFDRRMEEIEGVGMPYSLSVHAQSDVTLRTTLSQDSLEPGAHLSIRSVLTEYDLPVEERASVEAELTRPDGTVSTLSLYEADPGCFEEEVLATQPGVYRFHVHAQGTTVSGRRFTREDRRTAGIWQGGDTPSEPDREDRPDEGQEDEDETPRISIDDLENLLRDPLMNDVVRSLAEVTREER